MLLALVLIVLVVAIFAFLAWGQSGGVTRLQTAEVEHAREAVHHLASGNGYKEPEVHVDWPLSLGLPSQKGFVMDRKGCKLAFAARGEDGWSLIPVPCEDVLAVEVVLNGQTISRTSRTQQLGGALIGGALAGPAGVVVGGLSSGLTASETVSRVALQFLMSSSEMPTIEFCLWDSATNNGWANISEEESRTVVARAKRYALLLEELLIKAP